VPVPTTSTPDPDVDLVVVGCGPVGLMAAIRAAQQGLSVVAIDRLTEVYPLPRAIGMDDEIQRLFATAGMLDGLRSCSTPMPGAEFQDRDGRRVVGYDLTPGLVGPNGHPPVVAFDQPSLERLMQTQALAVGVVLRLGVEVVGLTGTTVQTNKGDITGRWILGADGASSVVRKLLDIALEDQGFDESWVVTDTTLLDPQLPLPRNCIQHCDPARVITFVPGHGTRRRWEFQLLPGETDDEMSTRERITELLAPWGTAAELQIDRVAVYRFHATVAERFRVGDVFIAGDAAHQMPPFNGQGMCAGMRDADNLAWKLAAVAAGQADTRLLDTYDVERRPHARGQVEHAADAGRLINAIAHGGEAALESGYGGGRSFPHLEAGCVTGDHPRVGYPFPQPVVDGTGFDHTLGDGWAGVTTAESRTDLPAGLRRVDADPAQFPGLVESGVTVLVRPDRYVAAVTNHTTDALHALGAAGMHFG